MTTGSTSYMRESFVEGLLRRKWLPQLEQSLRWLRLNVLCWCTSEACKYSIRNAVVMAAAMSSCSTAILAAKSILQIVHFGIERFTSAFARKIYDQMVALVQRRSLELHYQKLLKLVNSMKADVLFVGTQFCTRKRQKHYMHVSPMFGWCFKNKQH